MEKILLISIWEARMPKKCFANLATKWNQCDYVHHHLKAHL
jgi:hypothetical protein